jgi:hypothetical protein
VNARVGAGTLVCLLLLGCPPDLPVLCTPTSCRPGLRCEEGTLLCILDFPPSIDAGVPAEVQGGSAVTLTVVADDDVKVERVEYSVDRGAGWAPVDFRNGVGTAQVSLPSTLDIEPFPIQVRAVDGQDGGKQVEVTALVDRVAPRIALVDAGQLYRGLVAHLALVVVDGADGGGPVRDVSASFDGGSLPVTANDAGLYVAAFDLPQGIRGPLEVTFRARDAVGNEGTASGSITVNTTGPSFFRVPVDGGFDKVSSLPGAFGLRSSTPSRNIVATWQGQPIALRGTSPDYTVVLVADAGIDGLDGLLQVAAEDLSGNSNTTTLAIGIDSVAPDAGFVSPADMAQLTARSSVEVLVRAIDSSGFGSVRVDFDDDAGFRTVTIDADGGGSVAVPVRSENGVRHRMALAATDRLGNAARPQTRTVILDNVPPTLSFASPAAGFVAGGPGRNTLAVDVSSSDGTQPAPGVTISAGADTGPAALVSGTTFRRTVTLPTGDGVMLALVATATDAFGNQSSETRAIQVDTVAPAVTFVAPNAGATFNIATLMGATTLNVRFTATDGVRVASANLDFGDGQGFRPATAAGGNVYSIQVPVGAANGAMRSLTAEGIDGVGNVTRVTQSITIDTVAPTVSFVSPAANAEVGGSSLQVDVIAQDGTAAPASVRIAIGTDDGPAALVSGNTYRRTVTLPSGLDFASRTLTATVTDAAGNTGTASRGISIDNVAPSISFVSPSAGRSYNIQQLAAVGNVVSAQVNVSDGSGTSGINVEWRVNGGAWVSIGQLLAFSVATSATDNGTASSLSGAPYSVEARVSDRRGNTSNVASVGYTVDRVAPTANITGVTAGRLQPRSGIGATFSEVMVGTASAVQFTPAPPAGTQVAWAADRRSGTSGGDLAGATIYTVGVSPSLADTAGNPVVTPSTIRFSTAFAIPPRSTVLGSDVQFFDVASDPDGLAYAFWVENGPSTFGQPITRFRSINPVSGAFEDVPGFPVVAPSRPSEDIEMQATRAANADLTVSRRVGLSVGPIGTGASNRTIYGGQRYENQGWVPIEGIGFAYDIHIGAALGPPIPGENLGGRPWFTVRDIGGVTTVCRDSCTSISFNPGFLVGVAEPQRVTSINRIAEGWRSIHISSGQLRMGGVREFCTQDIAGLSCSTSFWDVDLGPSSFPSSGLDRLHTAAAVSSTGRCFGFVKPVSVGTDVIYFDTTSLAIPPMQQGRQSSADARGRWQVSAGAGSLMLSHNLGSVVEVSETSDADCGLSTQSLFSVSTGFLGGGTQGRNHRPGLIGDRKALFFINASNQLVVYYP